MVKLTDKPVTSFLDDLASSLPAPGGGSVAALSGALGAALISMVCNLTLGKKGYEGVQADIEALLTQSEALRHEMVDLLEADVAAYTAYSQAAKMPRDTDEQKAVRTAAMQDALKNATMPPLHIAEAAVKIMDLCMPAAEKGNKWAVSDAGVAVLMAEAALRAAALNVLINLGTIKDQDFVAEKRAHLDGLLAGKGVMRDEIYDYVASKL
ncbi:MAG: cyclodeaminase/cyclohydrolase family protein [Anaerolineae bacterium]|nr:cyclodeaminase/cyclohydrolase family protein [Anaerolineae bacterium]